MLKDKIVELCQLNNLTVKKLTIKLGFSEQSIYRWFKEDNLQLKDLKKIANYFGKDIGYFFDCGPQTGKFDIAKPKHADELNDAGAVYGNKDKYIQALEENIQLQKENARLKEKLAWYEANCECSQNNKTG